MWTLAVGLLLGLGLTAAAQVEVPLSIQDRSGQALAAAPLRGGVPLVRGLVREGEQARLLTPDGTELPCRVRAIARWYDGSVKWALVDAQLDLPANGRVALTLKLGEPTGVRSPRVQALDSPSSVEVDTGPARFLFSRAAFGVPAEAWVDLDADGRWDTQAAGRGGEFICEVEHQAPGPPQEESWLRDATGSERERYEARPDADYRVEVENANDLHVVVKLSGWLTNAAGRRLLQYVVRAHAYAGRPDLRIVHTFVYAGSPKQDFIRYLALRFPLDASGQATWALGGEARHGGRLGAGETVSLYEVGPEKIHHLAPYTLDKTVYYTVVQGNRELAQGQEAAGWARLADGRVALQLAMRNFRQMHPKELTIDAGGITVGLWPEHGSKVLDLRRRSDEIDNVSTTSACGPTEARE